jgi:hypothetical protein
MGAEMKTGLVLGFAALVLCACGPTVEDIRTELRETAQIKEARAARSAKPLPSPKAVSALIRNHVAPGPDPEVPWADSALLFIKTFEGASGKSDDHYFGNVTNDFDCQGASLGILQWNFGQRSAAEIVRDNPSGRVQDVIAAKMPVYGEQFSYALQMSQARATLPESLRMVRSWQTNSGEPCVLNRKNIAWIDRRIPAEMQALLLSDHVLTNQKLEVIRKARKALRIAQEWRRSFGLPEKPDVRELFVFLDFVVQNGGLANSNGVTVSGQTVKDFIERSFGGDYSVEDKIGILDHIGAWIRRLPPGSHSNDALHNIALWKRDASGISASDIQLVALAYLRADIASREYAAVVFNRKATLALGYGRVNKTKREFRPQLMEFRRKFDGDGNIGPPV